MEIWSMMTRRIGTVAMKITMWRGHTMSQLIWLPVMFLCSCHTILSCFICGGYDFHDRVVSLRKIKSNRCPSNSCAYKGFDHCVVGLPKQGAIIYLNQLEWMSDIHTHSIGLLDKAIKTVLGFGAWCWAPGHSMPPSKQESHRDVISKALLTYVTKFLAVMPKLTRT